MVADASFEGWVGLDPDSAKGNMVWQEYKPKAFEETDVDIEVRSHLRFCHLWEFWELIDVQITHCGVCGTDMHTLSSGWGPMPYPLVVGHEIVGKAVRVGKDVTSGIKVGDRVGVGMFDVGVFYINRSTKG